MTATTFGNITIPPQQDIPPAGFNHIAFRPACDQLAPVLQSNGLTAWTLAMPDGRVEVLAEYQPMDTVQAYSWLDGEGLCKIGGEAVPIVYSKQVPQRSIPQLLTQPSGQQPGISPVPVAQESGGIGGLMPILVGSAVIALVGGSFYAFTQRSPRKAIKKGERPTVSPESTTTTSTQSPGPAPDPVTGSSKTDRLNDLLGRK